MYQFLTNSQTSGRDISKTVRNIKKKAFMIFIYLKISFLTKFHFSQNVPLNDLCGFEKPGTGITGTSRH